MTEPLCFAPASPCRSAVAALAFSRAMVVPLTAQPTASTAFENTLMPQPALLMAKTGSLPIGSSFSYALTGNSGARLTQGAARLIRRLEMRTSVQMAFEPAADATSATLAVEVRSATSDRKTRGSRRHCHDFSFSAISRAKRIITGRGSNAKNGKRHGKRRRPSNQACHEPIC